MKQPLAIEKMKEQTMRPILLVMILMILIACKESAPRTVLEKDTIISDETSLPDDAFLPDESNDLEASDDWKNDEEADIFDDEVEYPDPDKVPDTDKLSVDTDDTDTVNDIIAMVDIPEGSFMMGCNEMVDDLCGGNEKPYHEVFLSAYRIGKYEVTTREYRKCVTAGFCSNNGAYAHYYTDVPYCNLGQSDKENHPVQCITWYGAKAFCEWKEKRLPTEAEWEKAARGTDGRKYPWGNAPEPSCDYAVMSDGGWGCGTNGTMPVGQKPLGNSPYGAYDMIGNAGEWVSDFYGEKYYELSPGIDPLGPESGENRISRGGTWGEGDLYRLRTSTRLGVSPSSSFYIDLRGFRCAESVAIVEPNDSDSLMPDN